MIPLIFRILINDPDVIIKIHVSNAFNTTDRTLTLDMISGRDSGDYVCGLKGGDVIPTVDIYLDILKSYV